MVAVGVLGDDLYEAGLPTQHEWGRLFQLPESLDAVGDTAWNGVVAYFVLTVVHRDWSDLADMNSPFLIGGKFDSDVRMALHKGRSATGKARRHS